jgi:ferrochelatase
VLVNLGTPAAPTAAAVRAFLSEFLSDPAVVDFPRWVWSPILHRIVLRSRSARVARQYRSIWTGAGSPLRVSTERIAAALQARAGGRYGVSTAYRYGEPSLDTTLGRLAREHEGRVIIVPLFPQRTGSTTGTAFRRAREAAARAGVAGSVAERLVAPDDPHYIAALAARWRDALSGAPHPPEHLVVSFHGIPARYDRGEGRRYSRDCESTTAALLDAIDWPRSRATLAYQSKFGPERWLEPATAAVIARFPARGVRRIAVITPGFLTDGLETIEEIGIRARAAFVAAGGESLLRVPAADDHPELLLALENLALT